MGRTALIYIVQHWQIYDLIHCRRFSLFVPVDPSLCAAAGYTMAIKVSSAMTLHVMLHTAMIAASMTSTVSVQVEGSFSTPSTSKCLTDDQLGKGLFIFSFFPT